MDKEDDNHSEPQTYSPPRLHTLRDLLCAPSEPDSDRPAILNLLNAENNDKDTPAATASTLRTVTVSHAALRRRALRFGAALRARGYSRGAVVCMVMPNCGAFVEAFFGVTAVAGMVAAPLNPGYTADEFAFYVADCEASVIIVPSSSSPSKLSGGGGGGDDEPAPIRVTAASLGIPIIEYEEDGDGDGDGDGEGDVSKDEVDSDAPPQEDDTALFLHTSGTTSRPKGVPLSHSNLASSIINIAQTYYLTPADRSLLVMPLFHVHGLMAATLATLATHGTVIVPPGGKFSASLFWPSALAGRPTWFTAVPTMHQILLARANKDYDRERVRAECPLRFIRSCSASLAPAVLHRLEQTFETPVVEAYAMTEAAHQMTSNPLPQDGERKPGSVGKPQGGVSLCIMDDDNVQVQPGTIGHVCVRGTSVTKGYHRNEKANKESFTSEGWFNTGDQGVLDKTGFLTLTGRTKELVNRGGEKISPLEVDAALLAHPLVKEAVSFAVPDDMYGEEVNAAVIPIGVASSGSSGGNDQSDQQDGTAATAASEVDTLTEEALATFAKTKLAPFKIPKRFFFCDDLPRTATGKIQRRIVAKHFLDKAANTAKS